MNEPVVKIADVWVSFEDRIALQSVDLEMQESDFVAIIGPNGGGKTTLIKVILGLIKPDRGTVKVLGQNPVAARQDIGYVPQHFDFDRKFPISVWDVVMMGRIDKSIFQRFTEEDKRMAAEMLEKVGMSDFRKRQIGKLSGGELQRVFLARALTVHPKLMILDEPTTGLDTRALEILFDILKSLNNEMPIILVSHEISAIASHVKSIGCLNKRFFYHGSKELREEDLKKTFGCPVDIIAHGIPHRVLKKHDNDEKYSYTHNRENEISSEGAK